MISFTEKKIKIIVQAVSGVKHEIDGLPVSVNISRPGFPAMNKAMVTVSGLSEKTMADLTFLSFRTLFVARNMLTVLVGDESEKMSMAFKGVIMNSYADFNASPDPAMVFDVSTGGYDLMTTQAPVAIKNETKVADVIAAWAKEMGYAFKNQGVWESIKNMTLSGSPMKKSRTAADAIGAELILDDGTLILKKKSEPRAGDAIVLSAENGLIGYPTFTSIGIAFRCFYNPGIKYGSMVRIESMVPRATGLWRVIKKDDHLTAHNPGQMAWESKIEGVFVAA